MTVGLDEVPRRRLQRMIASRIRERFSFDSFGLFFRRAERWLEEGFLDGIDKAEAARRFKLNIARIAGVVPEGVVLATVRLFCNAFPTTRRFQSEVRPCVCCGDAESDEVEHYVRCERIQDFSWRHLRAGWLSFSAHVLLVTDDEEVPLMAKTCVVNDCILHAIRARRINLHGASGISLMYGRLRRLCRLYSSIRQLVQQ